MLVDKVEFAAFFLSFLTQPQYAVVADEVSTTTKNGALDASNILQIVITVTDVEVEDEPAQDNLRSEDPKTHIEEEVKVAETVLIQDKSTKILRTLLTGLPSPTSVLLSLVTLLVNIGLVLAVSDFVYRARYSYPSDDLSFARIGYVSDNGAKLLIREPDETKMPVRVSIRKAYPKEPFDPMNRWNSVGGVNYVTNATDYTAVISIPLRGYLETTYHWVSDTILSGAKTLNTLRQQAMVTLDSLRALLGQGQCRQRMMGNTPSSLLVALSPTGHIIRWIIPWPFQDSGI